MLVELIRARWLCGWAARPVYSAKWTPEGDGRRIISAGHDMCIIVWNSISGMRAPATCEARSM
jgi:hypothetical protein